MQRRGGQLDFHTDRRGILWIMDEESVFPGASDSSFLDRVHLYHESKSSMDWGDSPLVKVIKEDNQFTLYHCQRTLPVLYDANGWVWRAREHPSFRVVVQVMAESKRYTYYRSHVHEVCCVFTVNASGTCRGKEEERGRK